MVRINRVYTRTGDDGTTGLASGPRVAKAGARIEAIGAVDEANSALGVARLALAPGEPGEDADLDAALARVQNDLFDLGADLATPDTGEPLGYEPLRVSPAQVGAVEALIDRLNDPIPPLRSFVLPGGSRAAAHLHLARALARRAERSVAALAADPAEPVSGAALQYINRLSDLLFVAARRANANGAADVPWVPGANR